MASSTGSDGAQQALAGLQLSGSSSTSNSSRDSDMASKLEKARSLTIRVLQEITDDFSDERKIGQGAYGKVYVAKLESGQDIAVKMLYNNTPGIDDVQFQREFENLMRLQHHNIVRLVGYCYETQHQPMQYMGKTIFAERTYRALCFEYMQNGSLQKHISDECDGLDWHTRYKIIKGTCEGLKHLHEGFEEPIYHLDLKPDNILLDKDMVPKLADFGLSKLFGDQQTMITQSPIGTIGYLPMEFLHGNIVSSKLDIFSLGVVMIKIIGGHEAYSRSVEMRREEFHDLVHSKWRNRMQKTCRVSRQLEAYCEQVNICTEIALSCMEIDRHKRPHVADIICQLNDTEDVIEKALSWSASSHSLMQGDLLKVQTFTRSEAIPSADTCTEFPVMVRVTAPAWPPGEQVPRTGVEVVAVLDINRSVLVQWKLNIIKEAMMTVIETLGPNDRLSVVSFDDNAPCIMKLTFMSDQGKDVARLMVNELTWSHRNNIVAGLREGAEILRGREVEEGDNRLGCILFLSDGNDEAVLTQLDRVSSDFPVHTLGLHIKGERGCGPLVMKCIADKTSGMYSYTFVDSRMFDLRDALKQFITGITSVGVTCVKIALAAHDGVDILSIESGGHGNKVSSDKQSGEIHIDNIYAGETKNFIVYLTIVAAKKKLLTVGGRYLGFNANKQLGDMDVFVLRPLSGCSPGKLAIHPEVASELVRRRLEKALSAITEQPQYTWEMHELWRKIKYSYEGCGATRETLSQLDEDLYYLTTTAQFRPYQLSWLSCHKWQRATTKGVLD
ncbi:hypothetical protein ACQ4PT_028210 [Festuca glaucescens]